MSWKDLKAEWDTFVGTKFSSPEVARDARAYMQLRLLLDIAGSLDSLSYSVRELQQIATARETRPQTGQ
jgi:hypothetical protein